MVPVKKVIQNSTVQSIIFGLVITLAIGLIWDMPIKKYNFEIDPLVHGKKFNCYWFAADFNGDGNTEKIRCNYDAGFGSLDMVHYDKDGQITDNIHFNNDHFKWDFGLKPEVYDIDRDGTKELVYFTLRNDSIFFNAYNLKDFKWVVTHLYFNTFFQKFNNYAMQARFLKFGDFDHDGNNELFFYFDAGFGLYPRGIFKISFPSLKITASPTEFMNISSFYFKDFNNDGTPELLTTCGAPYNSSGCKKYSDTVSYITVLDYNLNFLFEPIPMPGPFSTVACIPSLNNDSLFYASYSGHSNSKEPFMVMVLNANGKILKQKNWGNISNYENIKRRLKIVNNKPTIFFRNIGHFELTPDLDLLPDKLTPNQNKHSIAPVLYDLNGDGWDEWIYWNNKDEITIYNDKSKEEVTFESPYRIEKGIRIFPIYKNRKFVKYMLHTGNSYFYFQYKKNRHYYLVYIIYILILITVSGAVRLLLFFQKRNIEKRWQMEKQLSELQFNSIKNQLNPHFLFNALNSVAYLIDNGQKEEAYNFLSLNTKMIQRVMDDAQEIKRPLRAEIDFTKDYLTIQQHRFKERFRSEFTIHSDVDLNFEIPKMCIHTYVENAVKHGFKNTKTGGLIQVNIAPMINGVHISVTDNGMGLQAASEYKSSSGRGLSIMNEFYRLFEKYHGYKIETKFIDINKRDNKQTGIRVELRIKGKVR